ncbi:MAG: zinc ribbon-containing protein [Gammaproteobacteria bacterium]|nr:zinc ribbon-containing protein [Gammaproteobacteria bacterium]
MTEQHPSPAERLAAAYNRMMERLQELMEDAEDKGIPTLEEGIKQAGNKAVELGELTRDEAEKIGGWIKRDMEEASLYMASGGREFAAWLKFDIEQVEKRVLDVLLSVADRTKLELEAFERSMAAHNTYKSGEITGAGVLECMTCGEAMHFYATATIPACAKCQGTKFKRPRQ